MKAFTETDYIHSLITAGEHQLQDFKFEISDARKIAKTLSAFANTEGGRLLIGVKDNGRISGIRSDEEVFMVEAAAQVYCSPQVEYEMKTYKVEGKQVLVVSVYPSMHKPVYAKDEHNRLWAYVRIKDENILATAVHLRIWEQSVRPQGELTCYTEREQLLLALLKKDGKLSLRDCCKQTGIPRKHIETLLAKFIRYGIAEPVFENHQFYFHIAAR